MKFSEALTALIDEQYKIAVRNHNAVWGDKPQGDQFAAPTRDEVATTYPGIRIGVEVMGETGVGDAFYQADDVEFGTFENCREYGLTVTTAGWTFCVYEHRNSDDICIEGCPTAETQEYGPYGGEDKYDVLASFRWRHYDEAAKALIAMMHLVRERHGDVTRDQLKAVAEIWKKEVSS